MNIPIEPIQIIQMELEPAYELLQIIELEEENNKEFIQEKQKIEFGIKQKFYIINYLKGNYTDKTKHQIIIIENNQIPYTEFYSEIQKRTALIKRILLKYIEIPDIIKER